ncbi:MAG: hypothetical protein ACI8X3_002245, partial [Saprospiraceae bacterium]
MKKLVLSLVITLFACSFAMSQIVFSEIHFNPSPSPGPGQGQGSDADCEFLEL